MVIQPNHALRLLHRLRTQHGKYRFIILYQLAKRLHIIGIGFDELSDARRIIHRFVFQGGETVVEHLIGNIKLVALVFRAMDFVFQQLQSAVVLPDVCHTVVQRFLDALYHLVELFAVGSTAGFLIPYPADSLQFFLVRAAAE